MDKLKKLVPPRELCQKIPAGEFYDSMFYWFADLMQINENPPHEYKYTVHEANYDGFNWGGFRCCPAPTLQEIIEVLPHDDAYNDLLISYSSKVDKISGWHIYYNGDRNRHCYDQNAAAAALQLWLKLERKQND